MYVDVFDSGTSMHISPYKEHFIPFRELKFLNPARSIMAANGEQFLATGEGEVKLRVPNGAGTQLLTLRNVLYSPLAVAFALVSIKRADEGGFTIILEHGECRLVERASTLDIARVPLTNGIYQIVSQYVEVAATANLRGASSTRPGSSKRVLEISQAEFHRCLVHRSYKAAWDLILNEHTTGIEFTDDAPYDDQCDVCVQVKITRKATPTAATPAVHDIPVTKYGEKFHANTWDSNAISLGGNKKTALFIDDFTRYHHGFPIKSTLEAHKSYLELEASVLTQIGTQIKWLHSDNGSEFVGLQGHCRTRGTRWTASAPHTPHQNGVAERGHRVHREGTTAMLLDAGLPQSLWAHAYKHSVYIHNRTGHDALGGKTPYEARFGVPPDLRHLHPWSTLVRARQEKSRKLELNARRGWFVGLSKHHRKHHRDAIYVYWPDKRNITVVRNYIWVLGDSEDEDNILSEGARVGEVKMDAPDASNNDAQDAEEDEVGCTVGGAESEEA